ncbi:MAG: biopolymer transporter ExbD [Chitinophagaceae bacterium]|nr:biopolymer transporter ExbD [Chitinophagaceae bacterium]
MGRAKIKRGSTNIDMTAMCDVAFLLLSFFILTTKFKPAEAVDVTPPSSVSSKAAPQKDAFTVSIDKLGRIFIDMSDEMKGDVINALGTVRGIKFSDEDVKAFKLATFVGAPINQLNQFDRLTPEQLKTVKLEGIPADSANNELRDWIYAAKKVYGDKGGKINFLIKGDDNAKYPAFKSVIEAFKKNDQFKYLLITNPESIPSGSELEKLGIKKEQETE